MYFSVILMIAGTVIVGLGVLGQLASSWLTLQRMDEMMKEAHYGNLNPTELNLYITSQRALSWWLRRFTALIVLGALLIIISTKVS